jgi:glucans biosynthesis protein C
VEEVRVSRRIHYIDWLRVLAVLLLFPFHVSRVFNFGDPFYVKSVHQSMALSYALGFIDRWHMPLLFVLAGASTYLALGRRSIGQYAGERVKRLFVPLVFGILVLMPPQTWVGAHFNSGSTASPWHYLATGQFLRWNIQEAGDYYGGFGIGHLWFILFLFLMSLLALPFFAWVRGERGRLRVPAWSRRLARPAWWLLPPVVLFLAEALPEVAGKNFFYDLVFFLLGFIVISDDAFAHAAQRHRWVEISAGVLLCAAFIATGQFRDSMPDPSPQLAAANILGMLGVWLTIMGLLGMGEHHLDRPSPALSYLAEASYPVYILHQSVIVVAAFWIVALPLAGVLQWAILFVAAVALTFGLYEVVRRVPAFRFLFGMRPPA